MVCLSRAGERVGCRHTHSTSGRRWLVGVGRWRGRWPTDRSVCRTSDACVCGKVRWALLPVGQRHREIHCLRLFSEHCSAVRGQRGVNTLFWRGGFDCLRERWPTGRSVCRTSCACVCGGVCHALVKGKAVATPILRAGGDRSWGLGAGVGAGRQAGVPVVLHAGSFDFLSGRCVQEGAADACFGGGWLAAVVYECCPTSCAWFCGGGSRNCRKVCACACGDGTLPAGG
jgi:hypothetical protein